MGSVTRPDTPLMQEGINEVIVTIGENAAPMGIICRGGTLMMAVFRSSHTSRMIEETGMIVANLVHDPVLYVQAAFTDLTPADYTYEQIEGQMVSRLACAVSWIAYRTRIEQKTELKLLVTLEPVREQRASALVRPINRGFTSIIEATVHATRYILTRDSDLKRLIDHHADLVRRCGGDREIQALTLLLQYI